MAAQIRESISAREAAFRALWQVEQEGAYANLALKKLLDTCALTPADARLAVHIVYGTARQRLALDHILGQLLTRPLEQLMPQALVILRLSLYQLYYLDNAEPYAVTDEAVKLAKRHANPTLAKLVNGVLRTYLRRDRATLLPGPECGLDYLHLTLSYPLWLVRYMVRELGMEQATAFFVAQNKHPGLDLRPNPLRVNAQQLAEQLTAAGLEVAPAGIAPQTLRVRRGDPIRCPQFVAGDFSVQGAASQLPALALAPRPGSRVLDLCAAPGGKTTQMAELMQNKGELRAFDIHEHKLPLINSAAQRLGLTCITAQAADSAFLPDDYYQWADYILLDAPCTGLGVLNARPDSRFHKRPNDIPLLAGTSYRLLKMAEKYLKPGGLLCYSTCTVTHEENADNVARALRDCPQLEPVPLTNLLSLLTREEDIRAAQSGMLQLWPHIHDTEGFFIALLRKKN